MPYDLGDPYVSRNQPSRCGGFPSHALQLCRRWCRRRGWVMVSLAPRAWSHWCVSPILVNCRWASSAPRTTVVWTKENPTPWNDIKPDEGTKLLTVNQHFEKRSVQCVRAFVLATASAHGRTSPAGSGGSCEASRPSPRRSIGNGYCCTEPCNCTPTIVVVPSNLLSLPPLGCM